MAPGYRLSLPFRHTVISITTTPQGTERRGREEAQISLPKLWGKGSFCKDRGNQENTWRSLHHLPMWAAFMLNKAWWVPYCIVLFVSFLPFRAPKGFFFFFLSSCLTGSLNHCNALLMASSLISLQQHTLAPVGFGKLWIYVLYCSPFFAHKGFNIFTVCCTLWKGFQKLSNICLPLRAT